MLLDVAQLEAPLTTLGIGLDVGQGREPEALVRLRLAKALLGAAEAQALAAESVAIEDKVPTEAIAEAQRGGVARRGVQRHPGSGLLPAGPGGGRGHQPDGVTTAAAPGEQTQTIRALTAAAEQLAQASEKVTGLVELAGLTARAGRTGRADLS